MYVTHCCVKIYLHLGAITRSLGRPCRREVGPFRTQPSRTVASAHSADRHHSGQLDGAGPNYQTQRKRKEKQDGQIS
jgi:hypothetical protein